MSIPIRYYIEDILGGVRFKSQGASTIITNDEYTIIR